MNHPQMIVDNPFLWYILLFGVFVCACVKQMISTLASRKGHRPPTTDPNQMSPKKEPVQKKNRVFFF